MSTAEVQLARVEGARLARNPAVWLGFGLSAMWLRSAARTDDAEDAYNLLVGYGLLLPGLVMVVHTILGVLRARTSGADELLSAVPVTADRRSVGHAASTLVAGAVAVGWVAASIAVLRPGDVLGTQRVLRDGDLMIWTTLDVPRPNVAQLLQGPAALVAAACIAVAVARWLPTWLVAAPFAVAVMMQLTFAGLWSGAPVSLADWINPLARGWVHDGWVGPCGPEPGSLCELQVAGFDRVTPWWHLAYLVAIAVLFVAVAVLRHRRDRAAWTVFGVSFAVAAALVVVQAIVYERFVPSGAT